MEIQVKYTYGLFECSDSMWLGTGVCALASSSQMKAMRLLWPIKITKRTSVFGVTLSCLVAVQSKRVVRVTRENNTDTILSVSGDVVVWTDKTEPCFKWAWVAGHFVILWLFHEIHVSYGSRTSNTLCSRKTLAGRCDSQAVEKCDDHCCWCVCRFSLFIAMWVTRCRCTLDASCSRSFFSIRIFQRAWKVVHEDQTASLLPRRRLSFSGFFWILVPALNKERTNEKQFRPFLFCY